jgi:hypothetical protein
MQFTRYAAVLIAAFALSWFGVPSVAQNTNTFKGRLSKVPSDGKEIPVMIGVGMATGKLEGTKLTVTGTFEGMGTPATFAKLHLAKVAGTNGPAIGDLTVTKAASGTISGTFDLTPEQVEGLRKGGIYVQIHSDKGNENGHLWGFLLP